jgi:hypothetical protein
MLRKFLVNFKPKTQNPRYDARFDRGVTVSVMALSEKAAIKAAKAEGVHKHGDYPGSRAFDWWAAAI